ncbi:MAG: CapA family protein [Actinomycetota bacterium]|nr:CapA family protein [Actinomycetota bacterium]
MAVTLGLAGDTMLGRNVASRLSGLGPGEDPASALFSPELMELTQAADLFVLNLECCISERGERWPDPKKPFFFRAPPLAVEALAGIGVDAVTLANNHALDYQEEALLDTCQHLEEAGITHVGAGADLSAARAAAVLSVRDFRVGLVGFTDHPADYAAGPARPGVAHVTLDGHLPAWLGRTITELEVDLVVVSPHWGPNMTTQPLPYVRRAADALAAAGADLIAGHSAHAFHGVMARPAPILFDLGDFVDDYAVDAGARNDLGLLWLVTINEAGPQRLEAIPLVLEYCHTRLATDTEAARIGELFERRCRVLGTEVAFEGRRPVVSLQ